MKTHRYELIPDELPQEITNPTIAPSLSENLDTTTDEWNTTLTQDDLEGFGPETSNRLRIAGIVLLVFAFAGYATLIVLSRRRRKRLLANQKDDSLTLQVHNAVEDMLSLGLSAMEKEQYVFGASIDDQGDLGAPEMDEEEGCIEQAPAKKGVPCDPLQPIPTMSSWDSSELSTKELKGRECGNAEDNGRDENVIGEQDNTLKLFIKDVLRIKPQESGGSLEIASLGLPDLKCTKRELPTSE